MKWVSVDDQIPTEPFIWKDEKTGSCGIGFIDENGKVNEVVIADSNMPWIFEHWQSITHWAPLHPIESAHEMD